jgi:hypothetical protein
MYMSILYLHLYFLHSTESNLNRFRHKLRQTPSALSSLSKFVHKLYLLYLFL